MKSMRVGDKVARPFCFVQRPINPISGFVLSLQLQNTRFARPHCPAMYLLPMAIGVAGFAEVTREAYPDCEDFVPLPTLRRF